MLSLGERKNSFTQEQLAERFWSNKPQCVKVGDRQQHAGSQYPGGTGRFFMMSISGISLMEKGRGRT